MCGIFAIVSFSSMLTLHDAVLNLGEKARVLSYRGTQSAGILLETKNDTDAFYKRILQDKIVSKKQKNENPFIGFFEEFSKNENVTKEKTPFVGMIHTRWATTGGEPTEINAQPMKSEDDGEFALVLNGNLTNAGKLRKEIIRKSANKINFKTTTDTEVIARLFYEIYHEARNQNNVKKHGKTVIKFEELCKKVSEKCQGLFTIVVKSKHYPDEVVSFANRQPLYIGFGSEDSSAFIRTEDKNTYVCPGGKYFEFSSDSWALNTNIKYFYKLEEGDIAKLSKKGLLLIRDSSDKYSRKKKEYPIIKKYVYKNVNVGSTEGSMLREINEQSQCLSGIIYSRVKGNNIEFDEISDEMINKIIERRHFYFIGCGSSYNVGLSIKQAFTDLVLAETVTAVNAAMLVDDNHRVNAKDAVYIFITQSGTTSDTNMALSIS
ncbi:glutamine---fructose-6-phosphate transaminase (isomerizing) [Pancytospora epiphaga]|nr:glutamine---fructose-6-phosphate transaminase (isomerizing) [Pancytospora epiphaga]